MVNRWLTGRAAPRLEGAESWNGINRLRYTPALRPRHEAQHEAMTDEMTDEQLAEMHRYLAEFHRGLAREASLDVVQQYHSDLAQRLADEAALIPRRTAIVQRLYKREQQDVREREQHEKDDGG